MHGMAWLGAPLLWLSQGCPPCCHFNAATLSYSQLAPPCPPPAATASTTLSAKSASARLLERWALAPAAEARSLVAQSAKRARGGEACECGLDEGMKSGAGRPQPCQDSGQAVDSCQLPLGVEVADGQRSHAGSIPASDRPPPAMQRTAASTGDSSSLVGPPSSAASSAGDVSGSGSLSPAPLRSRAAR